MTRITLKSVVAALAVAGALAAAAPATTQAASSNPYIAEVLDQMDVVVDRYRREGFRLLVADWATIRRDGAGRMSVELQAGVEYLFSARCDGDCSDVDLVLEDHNGREIKADRDADDTPSFTFRPERSGRYNVKVEVANCSARQCKAGVVVLARPQPPLYRLSRSF